MSCDTLRKTVAACKEGVMAAVLDPCAGSISSAQVGQMPDGFITSNEASASGLATGLLPTPTCATPGRSGRASPGWLRWVHYG